MGDWWLGVRGLSTDEETDYPVVRITSRRYLCLDIGGKRLCSQLNGMVLEGRLEIRACP